MVKMKTNRHKKRGASTPKSSRTSKTKKAAKLSVSSRAVKKRVRASPDKTSRGAKPINKMKYYTLRALTDFFENKYNIEVTTEEDMTLKQMKYRNKYLFPAIKEGEIFKKEDLVFDENGARAYLECLARTLDKSDEFFMSEIQPLDLTKKTIDKHINSEYNIVIKKSSSLSTESDACSDDEEGKAHDESEKADFVDEYELEYLNKLKDAAKPGGARKQNKKWYGKACDIYRAIENHKKAGIFYEPYIPCDIDSHAYRPGSKSRSCVDYPITLKTIGVMLKLELYNSMDDFKADLKRMFENSREYLTNRKLLKDLDSIERHCLD